MQPRLTPLGELVSPTLATAHTVSSLLNNEMYRLPEWAVWAQRGLILAIGIYLMFILGLFRTNIAFFLSLFVMLVIFNAHFMLMSTQSIWLPTSSATIAGDR